MRSDNKQLALNIASQIVVFAVQMGINFLLTPFIVHSLGVEAYGFVGLSNSIISYLQLATVALNSMAGRFITIEYHKGNLRKANVYFSSVFYSNLAISLLLGLVSLVILVYLQFILEIPQGLQSDVKWLFALLSLNSLITLVFNVYIVSPFIKNRIEVTAARNLISNLIRAGLLVLLFGMFSPHLWFIGVSTVCCTVYLVMANILIKDKLTPELGVKLGNYDWRSVKELLSSGFWNLIGKLGDLLQRGFDLLFANWFINSMAMGILAVTTQIPFIILSVVGMCTSSFAPSLTKNFAIGDHAVIKDEMGKSIRILSIIILLPLVVLYVYGDVFYRLWMPTQDARLLQQLTVVGTFSLLVTSPLDGFWNIFTVTDKIKGSSLFMIANSVAVFVTVLTCLLLTDDIVVKMFVIASVRSIYGVVRGICFLPVYGALCLGLKWNYFYKPLKRPLIGIAVTLAVCVCARFVYMPQGWASFFMASAVLAAFALVLGGCMILNENDKNFIKSKLRCKL